MVVPFDCEQLVSARDKLTITLAWRTANGYPTKADIDLGRWLNGMSASI
jgi:hypothetical protein